MDKAELAGVLRNARARITPVDVGFAAGPRRQVPGLRREEVAQLAGLSVDYVVRLEQGRGPKPSTQVLGALARALRLSDSDRDLLFRLAGSEPPQAGRVPMLVRSSVLRLLDRMSDLPVMVLSAKSDVLAWNSLAVALLGNFSRWPPAQRNLIWQRFLGVGTGRLRLTPEDDAGSAAGCVGALRTAQARYPGDPDLGRLITELRSNSPRFEELWREGRSGQIRAATKTIHHPTLGPMTLECDALQVPDSDQTVIVYSAAPGTPEATALDLLRVTGTQQFSG
ncbi:helix-turn-helix domain-containing protein [Nocardia uniformis]|uniref:Helix-turn-helix domain-containing protein n=1 Tax=Nocardia uniformis TaxID=53432 RepID=A0A849BUG2_9NOCA|nr:helix-turn-helix transcriptional regulator [Nocardia uniformis]NNH70243.1 helix-turn-helix domain-containing protein [Nocardia uniformis]